MPKIGDVVADKYEIVKLIGEGGMGSVFMAKHKLTGKQVALKWMLPELAKNEDAVQRFLREAQAAGRINHPNVVDIYDVGQHGESYFLVMEYLQGEPLTDALERGQMEPGVVVDITLPCLRGVAAAHRKGVVHRDIKPDNIFLCRSEDGGYMQPKVLDFGISKLSGSDSQLNPRLTRTGAVMGTPYYMSPEQVRGAHDVDGRCDVYAFGVILYEALTGQVPFNADTYSALVLEIATGTPRDPRELKPGLPDGLAEVILKAMAREPDDRFQDIPSLASALEPFAENARFTMDRATFERPDPTGSNIGRVTSTPYTSEQVVVPGRGRSKTALVAGTAALVVAVLLGVFAVLGGGEDAAVAVQPPGQVEGDDPVLPGTDLGQTAEAEADLPGGAEPSAADAGGSLATANGPAADADSPVDELEAAEAKAEAAEQDAERGDDEVEEPSRSKRTARKPRRQRRPRSSSARRHSTTSSSPRSGAAQTDVKRNGSTTTDSVGSGKADTSGATPKPTRPGRTGNLSVDDF